MTDGFSVGVRLTFVSKVKLLSVIVPLFHPPITADKLPLDFKIFPIKAILDELLSGPRIPIMQGVDLTEQVMIKVVKMWDNSTIICCAY